MHVLPTFPEHVEVDFKTDAAIERTVAAEVSLLVLDTLEFLIQLSSQEAQNVLGKILEVLLHMMGTNQSTKVMNCIFATQRSIVYKFPELLFYEETDQCAELCTHLLRHCSSPVSEIRSWSCASLYLLMRQNFELHGNVRNVVTLAPMVIIVV